jgi:SAM-dependent methyltransferase
MEKVTLAVGKDAERLVDAVRERYGKIASGRVGGCCGSSATASPAVGGCCGPSAAVSSEEVISKGIGYRAEDLASVPEEANLGLGCGAPIDPLELAPGETVLDLGSGPGLDCFLAARRVGPSGRVIGVDMTPEMLERARAGAAKHGLTQVEFREGRLEALPVADASVDAVTSNCVINLVPDKSVVFREIARVLRPGGRLVISDIVLDGRLPESLEKDIYAYVGCVSGAAQRGDYFALLADAGLGEVTVLRDIDYLGSISESMPDEVNAFTRSTGANLADIKGKVRSITFRARKPMPSRA